MLHKIRLWRLLFAFRPVTSYLKSQICIAQLCKRYKLGECNEGHMGQVTIWNLPLTLTLKIRMAMYSYSA